MQVFDLYVKCPRVDRVEGVDGFRFRLARPVTMKEKETGRKVVIREFDADNTGDDVLGLYEDHGTKVLDPDKFEV